MTEPPIEASPRPDAPQLGYGLSRPRAWWRRRWAWVLIVLLPAAGWVFLNREQLSVRAQRAYWTRQCLKFEIPPGTKLIETDPQSIAALARQGDDHVFLTRDGTTRVASFYPRCLRELGYVDPRVYELRGRTPILSDQVKRAPIVFLHERISPGGTRRLVIVSGEWTNALDLEKHTDALALEPAKLTDPLAPPLVFQKAFQYSGAYVEATLQPGVADPADASHFTIPFDAEGKQRTLHGYLQDDGAIRFRKE